MKTLLPTPRHVELLELCHGYLRGAQILTTDGPKDIDTDDPWQFKNILVG